MSIQQDTLISACNGRLLVELDYREGGEREQLTGLLKFKERKETVVFYMPKYPYIFFENRHVLFLNLTISEFRLKPIKITVTKWT